MVGYNRLLKILWRRRLVAASLAASVVLTGYGFLAGRPKEYRATATLALFPNGAEISAAAYYGQVVERLVPAYAELIRSRTFLNDVSKRLSAETGAGLAASVFVEPVPGSGVIRVHAKAKEPLKAAQAATATARAFQQAVSNIKVVEVRILDEAAVNENPVAPNPKLALVASILLGLFVGGAGAVGWERVFGRIRELSGLAEASGLPVMGMIPRERSLRKPRIAAGDLALADFEESVRVLGTNLVFEMEKAKVKSIVILSLDPEAGRSVVAANLAVVFGELGFRVLVIDADGHHATQHELFGLPNDVGLSSIVLDGTALPAVVRATPYPGVQVVVAGPPLTNRMHEVNLYKNLVPSFCQHADIVIADAPPLRTDTDIRFLVSSLDAVVLLVRAGSLAPAELHATIESLSRLETKLLGTVLTFSAKPLLGGGPPSISQGSRPAIRV